MPDREVWIGFVEVVPEEGNDIFDGAPGAYANVLALAASVEDYMALRTRRSRAHLSEEILSLGEQARTGKVVWDTFYVFETENEPG